MNVKGLTLHGFKSFADRTELQFNEGVTAIVGPNGCGKSNISDAIRWVLGEQRASAIRGSKMEEAIFQGTTERRAVNRAEVVLTVSNEDGRLPIAYDEVEIRRTVFREGGSDYELNRSPCRLKDILDLCRDTGLGANAYAIIEQGMVDAILSPRTDDRRQVFEEAAGIGRYKDRRKAARRRLEAAEADLARLEDVISEVRSKVRSLARQRGRARKYETLRVRRLSLEVALAGARLGAVREELSRLDARLEALGRDEPAARAALSTAETELEQHRLAAADVARERNAAAVRLEEVNRRIAEDERELAVADERTSHAGARLAQIEGERGELRGRIERLGSEVEALGADRERQRTEVRGLGDRVDEVQERQHRVRDALEAARQADDAAREREDALSRRLAQLEANAAGADERAADLDARIDRLRAERFELDAELKRLDEQGDLFADRTRELAAEIAGLEKERAGAAGTLERGRAEEDAARTARREANERADRLAAQVAALEAVEVDFDGYSPAVAAALTERDRLGGSLEPLAELLHLPAERAAALEGALASLLQVLVYDESATVDAVREALDRALEEDGTLALLPRASLPRLRALVDALEFAGRPPSAPVLIGRRERLAALRGDAGAAARARDDAAAVCAAASERVAAAEDRLRELDDRIRSLNVGLREMDADEAGRTGHRSHVQRAYAELETQERSWRAEAERAREEAAGARAERERLAAERDERQRDRDAAATRRAEREADWDAVRENASELRVELARAESALGDLDRRLTAAGEAIDEARRRLAALDEEEAGHHGTLERLEGVHREAGVRLEELFGERDGLSGDLRARDERLAAAEADASRLETRVRELRRSVEEQGETRHGLELKRAEVAAGVRGIRERLEAEWGRPMEQLAARAEPVEMEADVLEADLTAVTADLERLGPVNMLAIEQHAEEKERLEFLEEQREDLVAARDDLDTAIREINRKARARFMETFERIRENFRSTFRTLFEGGECDLWLDDAEDPLESPIEISASPAGKRTQRIHLLSGGERALTSLALLFAIYLVKPSPFCVLDEVDAPLDEANIDRLLRMLDRFKGQTQFIIITHNPRTIEAADWIYGVTMEEPGISSIVGVRLEEVLAELGAPA